MTKTISFPNRIFYFKKMDFWKNVFKKYMKFRQLLQLHNQCLFSNDDEKKQILEIRIRNNNALFEQMIYECFKPYLRSVETLVACDSNREQKTIQNEQKTEHIKRILIREACQLLNSEYFSGNLHMFLIDFCIPAAEFLNKLQLSYGPNAREYNNVNKNYKKTTNKVAIKWPSLVLEINQEITVCLHLHKYPNDKINSGDYYLCLDPTSGSQVLLVTKTDQRTVTDFDSFMTMIKSEKDTLKQILASGLDNEIIRLKSSNLLSFNDEMVTATVITETSTADVVDSARFAKNCTGDEKCFCANSVLLNIHDEINNDLDFGQIPHIDSDNEDDLFTDHKRPIQKNQHGIIAPTKITDISEKLLLSGIYLPGFDDVDGHPFIICDTVSVLRATLTRYEIATLLLYYSSVIQKQRRSKGLVILLVTSNENIDREWRVALDILDKALFLIQSQIRIVKILVWHRRKPSTANVTQHASHSNVLMSSNIQYEIIGNERDVQQQEYIKNLMNMSDLFGIEGSSYGIGYVKYQKNWVNFYRSFEPVFGKFIETGRKLMKLLIDLQQLLKTDVDTIAVKTSDESGFLEETYDKIEQVLNENELKRILNADRNSIVDLKSMAMTLQSLAQSKDVQFALNRLANMSHILKKMYGKAMQISTELKNRANELKRLKSLELEAKELSCWLQKSNEEDLSNHGTDLKLAADLISIRTLEKNFEQFYFTAMKYLKKVNDVVEEGNQCDRKMIEMKPETNSLHETVTKLKEQSEDFSQRLEMTRERLEDAVHCFNLLECTDVPVDNEIVELAPKTGNEKLLKHCESIKLTDTVNMGNIVQQMCKPNSSSNSTPILTTKSKEIKCVRYDGGISAVNTLSSRSSSPSISSVSSCYLSDDTRHQSALPVSQKTAGRYKHLLRNRRVQRQDCSCLSSDNYCTNCDNNSISSHSSSNDSLSEHSSDLDESNIVWYRTSNEIATTSNNNQVIVNSHLHRNVSSLRFPISRALTLDRKTQKTILLIMREMIQTERDYVQSLRYVIENYMPELNRDDIPQILRGQRNVIFGNIVKIFEFHSESFLKDLELCENKPLRVGRIFLKHSSKFYLYALYNKNKPKSDNLMAEYGRVFFKGKQLELNDKMDLASYLLKPVQRMGKYALLLQELVKALTQNDPQKQISKRILRQVEDLQSAEQMVRFQLRHGNDLLAMDSIRDCDINLQEQGRLLYQNEFLVWEGKNPKKSLRQIFLFDELILFTKAKRLPNNKNLDFYVYKNSMRMTDIGLTEQVSDSETKFEIWFRKRKPNDIIYLQAMSADIKNVWTEEISQLLWKQATRNREVRLAEMFSMGIGHKPCLDIRPNDNQISDRSISIRQLTLLKSNNPYLKINHKPATSNETDSQQSNSSSLIKRPYSTTSISSCSSTSTSSTNSTKSKIPLREKRIFNRQTSVESGICADISSIVSNLSEDNRSYKSIISDDLKDNNQRV